MKTKYILFSIALLFASLYVNAQNSHDYMTINYHTSRSDIYISINGETFINEKAVRPEKDMPFNSNPILKKIKEYEDKGWELVNFNAHLDPHLYTYSAFLKKKKETTR